MGMQTGENEQGLRKILDMTRLMGIGVLGLHFYFFCYATFRDWGLVSDVTDSVLRNIHGTGLFLDFHTSKLIALAMLGISLLGVKGRKSEKMNTKTASMYGAAGLVIYFGSYVVLQFHAWLEWISAAYMADLG